MSFKTQSNTAHFAFFPVRDGGERDHQCERHVSKGLSRSAEAWDLCPCCLCIRLFRQSCVGHRGKYKIDIYAQHISPCITYILPIFIKSTFMNLTNVLFFPFFKGGIYVFHLIEAYGSTRMSQNFLAICECLVIGWIYGGWTWLLFASISLVVFLMITIFHVNNLSPSACAHLFAPFLSCCSLK